VEAVERFIPTKKSFKGVQVGFLAASFHICDKLDAEMADSFFFQAVTGEEMSPNVSKLRETVAKILGGNLSDKRHYINSAFRQVWNAERTDETLKTIKLTLNLPEFK
jgi:hypothetical protein